MPTHNLPNICQFVPLQPRRQETVCISSQAFHNRRPGIDNPTSRRPMLSAPADFPNQSILISPADIKAQLVNAVTAAPCHIFQGTRIPVRIRIGVPIQLIPCLLVRRNMIVNILFHFCKAFLRMEQPGMLKRTVLESPCLRSIFF